ncbi:MAG: hypothetical protein Q4F81_10455 [Eubacteriales bacterium]|nr:hypothetical protein [Eubacteriales bacterium]
MVWCILLGTLAAYGALSAIWAALGWLLPGLRGCALVYMGTPREGILRRWRWLRGLGLVDCPFLTVTEDAANKDTEVCGREALLERLIWEAERFGGTGTGDHSGRGQRRGISEL